MRARRPLMPTNGPLGPMIDGYLDVPEHSDPWDEITPEEKEIVNKFREIQQRVRQKQMEQEEQWSMEDEKRRAKEYLEKARQLFRDPELREMMREIFAEAKKVKEEA